jgi:aminobenzoyl-glutamate utilization protein B
MGSSLIARTYLCMTLCMTLCMALSPGLLAAIDTSAEVPPAHTYVDAAPAIRIADAIWGYAEVGYQEVRSSNLLAERLRNAGFSVTSGVADIPTAFVASFGSGTPVIGLLAEFDALPGMSQAARPEREPVSPNAPGHACGHHLFGSASVAAGIAVAQWLQATGAVGTVRVYGTPAEEGGSGKVYMTRAGLFKDVDAVLHWHPDDRNDASPSSSTANKSARFQFLGQAAHAASAPERGRSALDAVEAMNMMANLMREHMPSTARMHYIITKGGTAPNIVPEFAEVYYYVRHPSAREAEALFERLVKAAQGAALGTETQMTYEVMHGNHPLLVNDVLAGLVNEKLQILGGIEYDEAERDFAQKIRTTFIGTGLPLGSEAQIQPLEFQQGMGSTDVGDVSWNTPTVGLRAATWVPGTPAHSWQAVAAGGMSIGHKGMLLAAKVLADSAATLMSDATTLARARAEFSERTKDFQYWALLGDRAPPLDYRN